MAVQALARRQFQDVFSEVITGKVTLDMPNAATGSGTFAVISQAVPGASLGDIVLVAPAVDVNDSAVVGNVTSANVVEFVLLNNTAGARDLASTTYNFVVLKPNPSVFI
jgi:hypothetical protein